MSRNNGRMSKENLKMKYNNFREDIVNNAENLTKEELIKALKHSFKGWDKTYKALERCHNSRNEVVDDYNKAMDVIEGKAKFDHYDHPTTFYKGRPFSREWEGTQGAPGVTAVEADSRYVRADISGVASSKEFKKLQKDNAALARRIKDFEDIADKRLKELEKRLDKITSFIRYQEDPERETSYRRNLSETLD